MMSIAELGSRTKYESGTDEEQGRLMMREANIESIKSAEERERG